MLSGQRQVPKSQNRDRTQWLAHPGAWPAVRHSERKGVRARLRGAGAKAEYPFYPTPDLVEAEFDTIWAAQSGWNRQLTADARTQLRCILTFQRPLRQPPVGKC